MSDVTVRLPEDVAARAATVADERGVTVDELAAEALVAYLPPERAPGARDFVSIGIVEGPPGFSAAELERQYEDGEFGPSPYS